MQSSERVGSGSSNERGVIFVVATPIGNLDDLTPRAARILASVDIIAAEDTRHTKKLLQHIRSLGLTPRASRIVSYHDHVEAEKAAPLVDEVESKALSLALVSDAGTPCIADPGYRLVREAKKRGLKVHPIPGPSALTSLVSASGLPSDRVLFIGFLPSKPKALRDEISSWNKVAASGASIVFFETTRRLARSLEVIVELLPGSEIAIGRELTKLFEEIETMPIEESLRWVAAHATLKGEATCMLKPAQLGPAAPALDDEGGTVWTRDRLLREAKRELESGASLKDLLQRYATKGFKRPELYRLLLEAKAEIDD